MSKKNKTPRTVLNVPLKKPTPGDVEAEKGSPRTDTSPEAKEELRVHKFEDGTFLKFAPNPIRPNTFVIFDGSKKPLAAANSPAVANLICSAVTFALSYQQAQEGKRLEEANDMADALAEPAPTGEVVETQPENVVQLGGPDATPAK